LRASKDVLADLAKGQRPYATIVGCSDSRVAPELLFDAGLGDLFVIRVAGSLMSPEVFGSVQYAGTYLGVQLVMVLGHDGCGVVKAALAARCQGARERARIQTLLQRVLPGLADVDPRLSSSEQMAQAVEANVRWSMRQLLETAEGRARLAQGKMKLVGAVYETATGRVRLLA